MTQVQDGGGELTAEELRDFAIALVQVRKRLGELALSEHASRTVIRALDWAQEKALELVAAQEALDLVAAREARQQAEGEQAPITHCTEPERGAASPLAPEAQKARKLFGYVQTLSELLMRSRMTIDPEVYNAIVWAHAEAGAQAEALERGGRVPVQTGTLLVSDGLVHDIARQVVREEIEAYRAELSQSPRGGDGLCVHKVRGACPMCSYAENKPRAEKLQDKWVAKLVEIGTDALDGPSLDVFDRVLELLPKTSNVNGLRLPEET